MFTSVSQEQRTIHMTTEALAVFAIAPFLVWAATRDRKLNKTEKGVLMATAVGTVLVDGWLLYRYSEGKSGGELLANPWAYEQHVKKLERMDPADRKRMYAIMQYIANAKREAKAAEERGEHRAAQDWRGQQSMAERDLERMERLLRIDVGV